MHGKALHHVLGKVVARMNFVLRTKHDNNHPQAQSSQTSREHGCDGRALAVSNDGELLGAMRMGRSYPQRSVGHTTVEQPGLADTLVATPHGIIAPFVFCKQTLLATSRTTSEPHGM